VSDRYGQDVLADFAARRRPELPTIGAELGLVLECPTSGFCGAVVEIARDAVLLEDRHGRRRAFPCPGSFLVDGRTITVTRPAPAAPARPGRSASGSTVVTGLRARVARAGRIYVEGRHDAELVERVWGHDLRVEGVVVEPLDGVDDLPAAVRAFRPGPDRRLGVLVDHLVPGSKEARIAAEVTSPHVLVVGHPYVDVWQAVRPAALGIEQWPQVPKGESWKHGVCTRLGWPARTPEDLGLAWRRILDSVHSYADLEPRLLGRVEELIDFVTAGGQP
jgi:hypothetical protein